MHRHRLLTSLPLLLLPLQACTSLPSRNRLQEFELVAMSAEATIDSSQAPVAVWTYGGSVPGPQLRVRQGDRLRVPSSTGCLSPPPCTGMG